MLNKFGLVLDVLDIELLSVGKDVIVFFDCDSLLEATVSVSGSLSPGASVSSTNDVIFFSVLEAVGNLDPFPGFLALTDKCGKFCSLVSSPSSKSISLCLLEGFECTSVSGLGAFASLELFSSVGSE